MKNQISFLILFIVLGFYSLQAQVTQEWVARYSGPGNGIDYASSLAVDGSGNVYVTGKSRGSNAADDYATIKYNSSGDSLWVRRYNGPGNSFDKAYSLAVDGSGNVYVTGISEIDYATIKYNSSGVQQWVQRYYGPAGYDLPSSLAIDDSGNVYVAGYSHRDGIRMDYATIKYNSSGVQQWVQRYNGLEINDIWDYVLSLAVDNSGNVYVTGGSTGTGTGWDYATIKYNSSGDSLWVARYNGPGNSYDYPSSLAIDDSGNVYVTGYSNADYATIKYNSSGVKQWVQIFSGPGNDESYARSLAVDDSGNVYVTGFGGVYPNYDYVTIKYHSSGVQQWVRRYTGGVGRSLAVDHSGNVYVTGGSGGAYATIKYNSLGDSLWVRRYNGPGGSEATSLAIDVSGSVYVTGSSIGSGTGQDYATIKYSQSTGISQTSNSIPEKFSLSQNYPNPFNPKTIINYRLSMFNFVSLKIFDVLGNEVATLVNEKQNAGSYEVDFDGSNFSSGVYFYKLQTDNFSETKKMTLIK